MSVFLMEHKFATVRLVVRATHLLITIFFFAKPFIDTEYVVILTKGANGKFITEFGEYDSSGNRNRSVDKCSVHYDATTANYTKTISWVAIGRWK